MAAFCNNVQTTQTLTPTSSEGKANLSSELALFGAQLSILSSLWTSNWNKSRKQFRLKNWVKDITGKRVSWMFWLKQIESRQEEGAKLWKWQSQWVRTRVKADTGKPRPRSSGKVWTRLVSHQLFINATNGRQRSSPLIYITFWTDHPMAWQIQCEEFVGCVDRFRWSGNFLSLNAV